MAESAAFEGQEFDWFARDADGRFALFATAGSGPIPDVVLECAAPHEAAAALIVVSGWGSPEVWRSYSSVGLYVYDWNDQVYAYCRVAVPDGATEPSLYSALASAVVPTYQGQFGQALEVRFQELQHGT
jgi:hypothetical protein